MLEDLLSSGKAANLHRLIFLALVLPLLLDPARVRSFNLPPLSMKVNDLAAVLNPIYSADLDWRLARFAEKTGYAIYIVVMDGDYRESLLSIGTEAFELNQLADKGSAGTVLLLIATQDARVAIATSKNLHRMFSRFQVERNIENILQQNAKQPEMAVECALDAILNRIDRWFYVLDPPSPAFGSSLLVRSPMAEMILLPAAPLLGLMTGLVLMAFTSAGTLPWLARFFVSGYLGCSIVVVMTFMIRQPGGILPGMFFYATAMGFTVSGTVGALKPFWFTDTFKGKKSDEWWAGPVHFWRG